MQSWLDARPCPVCQGRAAHGRDFCAGCAAALPYLGPACPRCAAPHDLGAGAAECGRCQTEAPAYTAGSALFRYAFPVDRLIQGLKYHGQLHHARVLGEALAAELAGRRLPERILPVPLHAARLRERGYNQSLELARVLARRLKVELDYRSLQRTRATAPQTGLPLEQRARNVRQAFALAPGFHARHVAIVDDVMTSGHTANAAAKCLRHAGVEEVEVWVVARA
ncbi:MAG: ComF family protein [Gammaproteobacteria bacterium]|nr:ComF family protein [Gammaproteobacteria bacterium]